MAEREALLLSTQMLRVAAVKTPGVFFSTSAGGVGLEATPRLIILDGIIIRQEVVPPDGREGDEATPSTTATDTAVVIQEVYNVAFDPLVS